MKPDLEELIVVTQEACNEANAILMTRGGISPGHKWFTLASHKKDFMEEIDVQLPELTPEQIKDISIKYDRSVQNLLEKEDR